MDFVETLKKMQRLMGVGDIEDGINILEEDAVKKFIKSDKGTVYQVAENWCLVHYCFCQTERELLIIGEASCINRCVIVQELVSLITNILKGMLNSKKYLWTN
jgi:hypothetical protein